MIGYIIILSIIHLKHGKAASVASTNRTSHDTVIDLLCSLLKQAGKTLIRNKHYARVNGRFILYICIYHRLKDKTLLKYTTDLLQKVPLENSFKKGYKVSARFTFNIILLAKGNI